MKHLQNPQRNNGVMWTTLVTRVDTSTGEILRNTWYKEHQSEYLVTKVHKQIKINQNGTKGIIIYTIELKKHPQQKLKF